MKKKISIFICVFGVLLISCLFIVLSKYRLNQTFTYEIDKEKGEVTITAYLGDAKKNEARKCNYTKCVKVPEKIDGYPVTTIGKRAFQWGKAETIILPESITTIEEGAFFGCKNLQTIEGIENVETIGDRAFSMCYFLEEWDISNVKELGEGAFSQCNTIRKVQIPEGINVIKGSLCYGMGSLSEVSLPESVTTLESRAFGNCPSLKAIYLSPNVKEIWEGAFANIEDQLTIYGESGSYAEEYAKQAGIKFVAK